MASSSVAEESQNTVEIDLEACSGEDDYLFASLEQEEILFARYDIVWQAGRGIYASATDCGGGYIEIRGKAIDASWTPEYEERGPDVPWSMPDVTVEETYECRADFVYANYRATYECTVSNNGTNFDNFCLLQTNKSMKEDLGDNMMNLGMLTGLLDDEGNSFLYWLVRYKELPYINYDTKLEAGAVTYGWAKKSYPAGISEPLQLSKGERQTIEETIITS